MTQFRERNPIPIALVSLTALVVLLYAAFNAAKLPVIGGGTSYAAAFAEASNLKKNADVRIAGLKVGTVTGVRIEGDHVRVAFRVDPGTFLGDQTRADIKLKTLLGAVYVALTPYGDARLSSRTEIPEDRTTTPLIVTAAFQHLANNVNAIDVRQLARAFDTLSGDFAQTPSTVRATLSGLSALSRTISSRDAALQHLLTAADGVTATLASRDSQLTRLITDGDTVLQLVQSQRDVIHQLLVNTSTLSGQLQGLVADNTALLGPALRNLGGTLAILTKDQAQLDDGIHLLAPYVRDFTNTLSTGDWFDTYIANLDSATVPGCFTATLVNGTSTTSLPLGGAGTCPK